MGSVFYLCLQCSSYTVSCLRLIQAVITQAKLYKNLLWMVWLIDLNNLSPTWYHKCSPLPNPLFFIFWLNEAIWERQTDCLIFPLTSFPIKH